MLTFGQFFGGNHGIKRGLRRYAADEPRLKGVFKLDLCKKDSYDSKKLIPGACVVLITTRHCARWEGLPFSRSYRMLHKSWQWEMRA